MDNLLKAKNAIKIQSSQVKDVEREIHNKIADIFGKDDGSYFIHTEQLFDSFFLKKQYKILLIEDKAGQKHEIWFELQK